MKAAIYARVSTLDQQPENQLAELRRYVAARGWEAVEYIDHGVSGSRESRPALDRMLKDARRRRIDHVVCWRLDRLGRSLRHLVMTLSELEQIGVGFISINEGIDFGTAAGRLQMHVLAAISEFERSRIIERVHAGLARARAQGTRLGRPRIPIPGVVVPKGLTVRKAAALWGVSRSTAARRLAEGRLPATGGTGQSQPTTG
jgi:DNA invertase Pin-like site-specific DNA recombinase